MAILTLKFEPHELSKLVPRPTESEQRELDTSVAEVGLQAPGILYEGKVLDGNSRQIACARAQREFRYVEFMHLHPDIVAAGPLAFVIAQNLKRRHLTTSQRSIFAAKTLPAFEAEAKKRKLAGLKQGERTPELDDVPRGTRGSSASKAGAAFNVSEKSVRRAKKLIEKSPAKAEKVAAGKMTLGKATAADEKPKRGRGRPKTWTRASTVGDLIVRTEREKSLHFYVEVDGWRVAVSKAK